MNAPGEPPPRAGRREWMGLAVIALPCALYAMDLTVLNLAVPRLSEDLRPSAAQLLWIVDIYGFLVAGSLITMGGLGDRFGRRRLLLVGAAAFGVASVLAAFAPSVGMLIAARALLGVAGATVAPSTLSLIRNMFHDPAQRTFAIGVWGTAYSVGGAIGPPLGGVLLEYFWWGSVFLLAVPVMALVLVLGPKFLPEYRNPSALPPDFISAILSLIAVLAVIYGLKQIAEDGPGWSPALSIVAGLLVGAVFFRRQRVLADPLIDLRLFKSRAFSVSVATNLIGIFIVFGTFLFTAQYLQLVLGLSPLHAGLWTLPSSIAVIFGSMLAPTIVQKMRPPLVLAGGLGLVVIGLAVLALVGAGASLVALVVGSVILSLGLGPVFILTVDLIMSSAPPERAGAAAAISETGAEFGGALGIAILGSLGTAVYRAAMAHAIPEGVPAEVAETARDTLGGAVAAAGQLSGTLGGELLIAARAAFAQGFELVVVVCAVIAMVTAVLAAVTLRKAQVGGQTKQRQEPST